MPHKEVKKSISELKTELQQLPKETDALEQKLDQIHDSIEQYTPEVIKDFVSYLDDETKEFEVEHPQITALLNQVMTALSNIGI